MAQALRVAKGKSLQGEGVPSPYLSGCFPPGVSRSIARVKAI